MRHPARKMLRAELQVVQHVRNDLEAARWKRLAAVSPQPVQQTRLSDKTLKLSPKEKVQVDRSCRCHFSVPLINNIHV
jgi:hypothetical protein